MHLSKKNALTVLDITRALMVQVLLDDLQLWDLPNQVELREGMAGSHIFRLFPNGKYSAKSAYKGFFVRLVSFEPYARIWRAWAPPKCNFFMWLVAHNRCCTADRLACRDLPQS